MELIPVYIYACAHIHLGFAESLFLCNGGQFYILVLLCELGGLGGLGGSSSVIMVMMQVLWSILHTYEEGSVRIFTLNTVYYQ
ncbi:hypothetical protein L211DRAFT_536575 [Terfezia boudieri ATCC MYA-4762]|uniref:Uncharacterized protein n=1 Tax=Terfezia boudieri ATCC MYA-4762 TaxID=1051890 RepID=A0A3N4LWU3_9PEZI|nr:hypothetical protein L211DRAFT_536575 [Terfezia boudieri ATCC MYA-4762]